MDEITTVDAVKLYTESKHRFLNNRETTTLVNWCKDIINSVILDNLEDESNHKTLARICNYYSLKFFFEGLTFCTCCARHMTRRPISVDESTNYTAVGIAPTRDNCVCDCRHSLRVLRHAQFYMSEELSELLEMERNGTIECKELYCLPCHVTTEI